MERQHRIASISLMLFLVGGCQPAADADVDEVGEFQEGKADTALPGPLRVTEAMFTARSGKQYVELLNTGAVPVELTEFKFATRTTARTVLGPVEGHPSVVPPGALAVLVDDAATLEKMPAWIPAAIATSGKLGGRIRSRDTLRLFDPAGKLIERSGYTSKVPVPAPDVALERTNPGDSAWVASPLGATPGLRNASFATDNVHLCFNTPPFVAETSCQEELVRFLARAGKSIDVAVFQVNLPEYFDALLAAKARGVKIRIVTDTDYSFGTDPVTVANYRPQYDRLIAAGIPVVDDKRSPLMHTKFVVVDGELVWTGSYNFLALDNPPHAENALWLRSPAMAAAFEAQFEQLFSGKFGPKKVASTQTDFYVDGMRIEAYFAPKDPILPKMIERFSAAKTSINFAIFSFFQHELSNTLAERWAAKVDVRGVLYTTATGAGVYRDLVPLGMDLRIPLNRALFLHNKFSIVDENGADPIVLTGSFNYSDSATASNDESIVFIHDAILARAYGETFRQLYLPGTGDNIMTDLKVRISSVAATAAKDEEQYVELENRGETAIDLTTVEISDGDERTRLAPLAGKPTLLAAGAKAWVVSAGYSGRPGAPAVVLTTASGQIGDGLEPGDIVQLHGGAHGNVIDSFSYSAPAQLGVPWVRSGELDLAASWTAAR